MERSLPPLPNNQKEFTYVYADSDINLPAVESDVDMVDEVLQNHLIRVQESIMNTTDAKVSQIEAKLNESNLKLKRAIDEKANTGVALYKTRKEVGNLNKALASA
jgi:hypothetical protein